MVKTVSKMGVYILVISLVGMGTALSLPLCPCKSHTDPGAASNPHQNRNCCSFPVETTGPACTCGDDCRASLHAAVKDFIVSVNTTGSESFPNNGSILYSNHPFEIFDPRTTETDCLAHDPPSPPVYLQTCSLRC